MARWTASAPLRADLAGGTIDLWPLYLLHRPASTVNVALRIRARAAYKPGGDRWQLRAGDHGARRSVAPSRLARATRESGPGDPFALALEALSYSGVEPPGVVTTAIDGPSGAGLGGSSALLVALLGLFMRAAGKRLDRARLPDLARDLEAAVLRFPTGVQDYCPAIHGGALQIHYEPGQTRIERIDADLDALEARLLVAYSGKPHSSAPSNWGLFRRRLEEDTGAVAAFAAIRDAAARAGRALRRDDWRGLGAAMNADWEARKRLDPGLAPEDLQRVEAAGRTAGIAGAKCCGAASGGCMLFLLRRPGDRARVTKAVESIGARVLPATIARSGLRVSCGG